MQLTAQGLVAIRGERIVFRNVGFELSSGEALILHGPNGSGKTTLLRAIAGLLPLMAGNLTIMDGDGKSVRGEYRDRSLHFIGHQDPIRPQLRVAETLRFHAALLGAPLNQVNDALGHWNLSDLSELSAGYLSAGQRRRLSLARLSLQSRPLWLLDEPTLALDAASRDKLKSHCDAHLGAGGMIIAATHEAFLGDPKILQLGTRH